MTATRKIHSCTDLFTTDWVSLRLARGDDWSYVYSHETRCSGRIVAVLPYRDEEYGRQYLVRREMTPCWGPEFTRSAITGGWEGGDIEDDALRELAEEAGYTVTRQDLIPLGTSRASKSSDTEYSLFSANLIGLEAASVTGDGTALETECSTEWVYHWEIPTICDPQVSVMAVRLISYLENVPF